MIKPTHIAAPKTWTPLLADSLQAPAVAAVEAIAQDLRGKYPEARDYSYAGGLGGVVLFLATWASTGGSNADRAAALSYLERAWRKAEAEPVTLGLFAGLTGLVLVSREVSQLLGVRGVPDGVEEIDSTLIEVLERERWKLQYDLIYGLAGLGVYAALHPDREVGRAIGSLVVEQLGALAIDDDGGLRWATPREYRPLARRETLPAGYCDLGVAHGIGGIVGMLARLNRLVETSACRQLLDGTLSFLLRQRRHEPNLSKLPAFVPDEGENCRSAWCYGDIGIGVVLIGAGRRLDEPEWVREGEALLLGDASRPMKSRRIGDCSVCHGGAGVAHLYARAHSRTGNPALRREALRWYRWTLDQRREGTGIGGFLGWVSERRVYEPTPGLLVGSSGIGLALASALDSREPVWDRPLLAD